MNYSFHLWEKKTSCLCNTQWLLVTQCVCVCVFAPGQLSCGKETTGFLPLLLRVVLIFPGNRRNKAVWRRRGRRTLQTGFTLHAVEQQRHKHRVKVTEEADLRAALVFVCFINIGVGLCNRVGFERSDCQKIGHQEKNLNKHELG